MRTKEFRFGGALSHYMKRNDIEVLAPAGSPAIARAVIAAGADAVYFAGERFGARAFAPNFTKAEAAEMLDFVHLHRKKAYLTVNTLLKNPEMERQLYDDLHFYYEAGIDAVLVQDFGVLAMIREYFCDLPIHASTQMNITSRYGAKWLSKYGVKRIVAARELSLAEIRMLCDTSVEIEVFVHGALCVCYSGQCLMSSFLGGRSGNRGRCAQPCRLPYGVLDRYGKKVSAPGKYMLSPKDLCGIEDLPALIEAGVCSLKIEGRMKQAAYAATVTGVYRKYVDQYLARGAEGFAVSKEDRELLLSSGSRNGFTDAYFFVHNTQEMMSLSDSSHERKLPPAADPKETAADENKTVAPKKLPIAGAFLAKIGEPLTLTVQYVQAKDGPSGAEQPLQPDYPTATVRGMICEQAQKQPVSEDDIRVRLNKTGNSLFAFQSLSVKADPNAFIPMKAINEMRRNALEQLRQSLAEPCHRTAKAHFAPLQHTDISKAVDGAKPALFVRVCTEEQLEAVEEVLQADGVIVPLNLYDNRHRTESIPPKKTGSGRPHRRIASLPVVFRQETADLYRPFVETHHDAEYEVSSYDALGFLQEMGIPMSQIHAGYRLYRMSDRTGKAFHDIGIAHGSIPLELSERELAHRDNRRDRMLIYGRVPLMYTANCVAKNIGKCTKAGNPHYALQDRKGKIFPVACDCATCTNIIYNTVPTDLLDKYPDIAALQPEAVEVAFTTESGAEVKAVLKRLQACMDDTKQRKPPKYDFTRGHFSRSID